MYKWCSQAPVPCRRAEHMRSPVPHRLHLPIQCADTCRGWNCRKLQDSVVFPISQSTCFQLENVQEQFINKFTIFKYFTHTHYLNYFKHDYLNSFTQLEYSEVLIFVICKVHMYVEYDSREEIELGDTR